jgi:hypothetical protein
LLKYKWFEKYYNLRSNLMGKIGLSTKKKMDEVYEEELMNNT